VQPFVGGLEADLGGPVDRIRRLAEGLDGGPVDDPVRGGQRAPPARPQPAQQRGRRHVGTDQPDAAQHLGQVEVGGPDDLHAVDVDQLVVQHVLGQEHLAGAAHHVRRSSRAERSSTSACAMRSMADAGTKASGAPPG
jgi:hypothetical protein